MNSTNYQIFKHTLQEINVSGIKPTLLLHSCCAPCSSGCITQLLDYFNITILYYNPNISPKEEYERRKAEQIKFLKEFDKTNSIKFLDCDYNPEEFYSLAKGLEDCPERGERCKKCYRLRLEKTCKLAKELKYNYFASTLTLSPLKDEKVINEIGLDLQNKYNQKYLVTNFKKNNGYLNSLNLSKQYNLYRQDYCGCVYSKKNKQ